jgi:hypothetical protein
MFFLVRQAINFGQAVFDALDVLLVFRPQAFVLQARSSRRRFNSSRSLVP